MNVLLFICRTLHLLSTIIWLGGLLFQGAVLNPLVKSGGAEMRSLVRMIQERFMLFIWINAAVLLVSGLFLTVMAEKFQWPPQDWWSLSLAAKAVILVVLVGLSAAAGRMVEYLNRPSMNGGYDSKADLYRRRIALFRSMTIVLSIAAIIVSAGMVYLG